MTRGGARTAVPATLLALVASALGWFNAQIAAMPVAVPSGLTSIQTVASDPAAKASSEVEDDLREFHDYRVIAERPLFLPDRRAGGVAVAEPVALTTSAAPQWQLSGIILKGDVAHALLKADDGQPATWVRQGEETSGWRVERIDARGVLLKSGTDEQLVELYPVRSADTSPDQ